MGMFSKKLADHRVVTDMSTKDDFLAALAGPAKGSVTRAAELARIDRGEAYELKNTDKGFSEQWEAAQRLGEDGMEDEARRRAVEGNETPIFKDGKQIGVRRDYSDLLLIFLLKGAKPEKYKDRVENLNFNRDLDLAERLKEARKRDLPKSEPK